jgi:hypothetical protein
VALSSFITPVQQALLSRIGSPVILNAHGLLCRPQIYVLVTHWPTQNKRGQPPAARNDGESKCESKCEQTNNAWLSRDSFQATKYSLSAHDLTV